MQLEAWDESTKVTFDRQLWAELTSLRFVTDIGNYRNQDLLNAPLRATSAA